MFYLIFFFFFFIFFIFFFQAEDGIRDAQESRGLGDVYKRQVLVIHDTAVARRVTGTIRAATAESFELRYPPALQQAALANGTFEFSLTTVSYTHLTLPTIYSV